MGPAPSPGVQSPLRDDYFPMDDVPLWSAVEELEALVRGAYHATAAPALRRALGELAVTPTPVALLVEAIEEALLAPGPWGPCFAALRRHASAVLEASLGRKPFPEGLFTEMEIPRLEIPRREPLPLAAGSSPQRSRRPPRPLEAEARASAAVTKRRRRGMPRTGENPLGLRYRQTT
jgi:hypothetical protein